MKRILSVLAIMFVAGVGTAAILTAGQSADARKLQQAIDLIESKSDVKAATPLLEALAKSRDRAVAGRAGLWLARLEEPVDATKARTRYEGLVRDFAGITAIAAEARAGLS